MLLLYLCLRFIHIWLIWFWISFRIIITSCVNSVQSLSDARTCIMEVSGPLTRMYVWAPRCLVSYKTKSILSISRNHQSYCLNTGNVCTLCISCLEGSEHFVLTAKIWHFAFWQCYAMLCLPIIIIKYTILYCNLLI